MTRRWSGTFMIAFAASVAGAQEASTFGAVAHELVQHAAGRPLERTALARLYPLPASAPLWSVVGRGATPQALAAIDVLASAAARGLLAADYDAPGLRALAATAAASPAEAARFDVAMSRAVTRFIADLHVGRVAPASVKFDLPNAADRVDLAPVVAAIARAADVPAAISAAEPPYVGYRALERVLARYRELAADTTLRAPARARATVKPGAAYADAPALARLLAALGDLDTAVVPPPRTDSVPVYRGALVEAVVRFQRRHGLDPDGAIGPATMRELRVPLAERVRQIELTLERWRWLPERAPERYVVVNIPAFRLYAFEDDPTACRPILEMNVIVGQAEGRHDTPVFSATMREVVFRPYWTVPLRIVRNEFIPTYRRHPEYFEVGEFEIVRPGAPDAPTTTYPPTPANIARVAAGDLQVRQRPGPQNALGFVKFVFPNRYNVYLHGTPMQELFATSRRDYSHGCIRVEEPNDLAELVLRGQAPWDRASIEAAMEGTRTIHVPLARPFTVFVLYATAVANAEGGVSFYPDLYGHDRLLARALALPSVSDAALR